MLPEQQPPPPVSPHVIELGAPPAELPNDLPPLDDPYYVRPVTTAPRSQTAFLVGAAFACAILLGPIGALAAIVLGLAARHDLVKANAPRARVLLAVASSVLGVISTLAWTAGIGVAIWQLRYHSDPVVAEVEPSDGPPPPSPLAPSIAPPSGTMDPSPGGTVPKGTATKRIGAVTLVDVGFSTRSLQDELSKQRADAATTGETLLIMTTSQPCQPCAGFESSLKDQLMQTALAQVRVVRVDTDVFREDLEQLKIPYRPIPGFFLLSLDLTPKDGIDGGEWDDDIAVNIAPVLGAFMKGKYAVRRKKWQPLPGTGIRL